MVTCLFLTFLDAGFDVILILERAVFSRLDLIFSEDLLEGGFGQLALPHHSSRSHGMVATDCRATSVIAIISRRKLQGVKHGSCW